MKAWYCTDDDAPSWELVEAESAEEAAQEYAEDSGYEVQETIYVPVIVCPDLNSEPELHVVRLDPEEPACEAGEHDWQVPWEVVGGLKENPGCWGHGAGLIIKEVCRHCGYYRVRDTWATDPSDGTQGLETIEYLKPDKRSLKWVEEQKEEEEDGEEE